MKIWALADLHLSFGNPKKSMEIFGPLWKDYEEKIRKNCEQNIAKEDLLLLPGDLSWAMHPKEALVDLEWIDRLPGTKLIVKGNHDFWWPSMSKLTSLLPPSIHSLHRNAFHWQGVSIAGARLWDSREYSFQKIIDVQGEYKEKALKEEDERIYQRELARLKESLSSLDPKAHLRIAMTHYPPIGSDLKESRASKLLEEFNIQICVFGHLHSLKKDLSLFGEKNGIHYLLVSCDFLNFSPLRIY